MAGGRGTRLRPYTVVLPKPLMPIGDYPILEVVLRQLARQGFDHITICINYQAEIIQAFCHDGARWGIRIDYSREEQPLSTMGPLRLIADLPDNFLVMNGDVLTDLDFAGFLDRHAGEQRLFTISASERVQTIDYGVLETSDSGILQGFREKPHLPYLVSMGVYAVSRRILEVIPPGRAYGLDHLMGDLLERGDRVHVDAHRGYWLDIGRGDDYAKAIEDFDNLRERLLP